MDTTSIVEKLNVVMIDVRCTSGAVSKSDSGSDEAFTDGSVRFLDKRHLRVYNRARQHAARVCRQLGTRFLGGFAIPDTGLAMCIDSIKQVEKIVQDAKADAEINLPTWRQEWESKHPEVMPYKHRFPSNSSVLDQIGVNISVYKIQPQAVEGVADGIKDEIGGICGRVLDEIAAEMRDSFSATQKMATQQGRAVLDRVRAKCERFSFVDARLQGVADMITGTLKAIPETGPIRDTAFVTFSGLVAVLSEPGHVLATAERFKEGAPIQTGNDAFFGTTSAEGVPAAEGEARSVELGPTPAPEDAIVASVLKAAQDAASAESAAADAAAAAEVGLTRIPEGPAPNAESPDDHPEDAEDASAEMEVADSWDW